MGGLTFMVNGEMCIGVLRREEVNCAAANCQRDELDLADVP